MRTVYNILLLLLIGILASTYSFTLSPIDYSSVVDIPEINNTASIIKLKCEEGTDLTNPNTIVIMHVPDSENDISLTSEYLFTADIYKDEELILSNITNLESVSIHFPSGSAHISKENPMRTTLDISQSSLDLEPGNYVISIKSTIKEIKEENRTINLNVTYTNNAEYIPASNTTPDNKTGITLYFSDNKNIIDNDVLIPVTRFVDYDMSLNKKVIDELQKGPITKNMSKTIGEIDYTVYRDEIIYINIDSSENIYNENEALSRTAYYSMLKSMFALEKHLSVKRVRFTIDDFPKKTHFNGINVENSIPYAFNYKAYPAFRLEDRYYLVDFDVNDIKEGDSLELKAQKMFDFLINPNIPYVKSTIPSEIVLQNVKYSNGDLILDFNEEFLNSFSSRNDFKRMMIDSLVYSFTSLKMVNSISITVNGEKPNNFIEDIDISKPLYPSKYINPEGI